MEFIPHAEECGLILPIGDWGLAEACRQIQAWNRDDLRNSSLRVLVNLSTSSHARDWRITCSPFFSKPAYPAASSALK